MTQKRDKRSKKGTPQEERRAIVDRICAHLRAGGCSVRQACQREGLPRTTLTLWATEDPDLHDQYARAREDGLREDADNLQELAAKPVADAVEAASLKMQLDTAKWIFARRLPKEYGEKQQVEHTGTLTLEQLLNRSRQTEADE